jgi:hypothetical protein
MRVENHHWRARREIKLAHAVRLRDSLPNRDPGLVGDVIESLARRYLRRFELSKVQHIC